MRYSDEYGGHSLEDELNRLKKVFEFRIAHRKSSKKGLEEISNRLDQYDVTSSFNSRIKSVANNIARKIGLAQWIRRF